MNQYSNVQVRAKAYPGIRQLQVLQGLGDQGVVASICASNVSNLSAADFGYRQAVAALVGRIRPILRGRCFPRSLPINPVTGNVPCHVLEVFDPTAADCRCDDFPARHLASSDLFVPELRAYGTCACEIEQTKGADLDACLTEVNPPASASGGWCYVDPAQASTAARSAECELVRSCPADDRRIIRFVSPPSEPRPGSRGFIMCDENSGTPPSSAEPCP
jgi:hypothetical protein